ncbi:hypothetical protein TetV_378 [Tetraselmis virus 1]|uniref:Uncharacterized protein n=1 Tax=Tetraselmis virus 1 TaxID=2060617 RepID=A0A2P0VNM3_9VIRU|nr:hypothetical protein QJ968_gp378 [Tetraselmis virus 1]AUF82470.1 hypothetical protein TetV_378 [Tetraselmis virus 1]
MSYSEVEPAPFMAHAPDKAPFMTQPKKKTVTCHVKSDDKEVKESFTTFSEYANDMKTTKKAVELRLLSELDGGTSLSATDSMNAMLDDWLTITHHIMDYKYINDLNHYIKNVQDDESKRLGKQENSIRNDILITKKMYLMRQANADMLYSRIRILLHAMLFVSAIAFLYMNSGMLGSAATAIMVVLCVAFAIYILMYIKVSSSRRYDDWSKLYWNTGDNIVTEESEENDVLSSGSCVSDTGGDVPY